MPVKSHGHRPSESQGAQAQSERSQSCFPSQYRQPRGTRTCGLVSAQAPAAAGAAHSWPLAAHPAWPCTKNAARRVLNPPGETGDLCGETLRSLVL